MTHALLTIASNPASAETEAAYNEWYSGPHLADIRATPGVVAAHRYRLGATQLIPGLEPDQRYLMVCELEVDDLDAAIADLASRDAAIADLASRAAAPEAAELMQLDPLPTITVWERVGG